MTLHVDDLFGCTVCVQKITREAERGWNVTLYGPSVAYVAPPRLQDGEEGYGRESRFD